MKDLYKIRRHIEKDLINRLIKSNRKLDFDRLWYQFSKRTISKGIDKQMYRAYLEQKVFEGKLVYDQTNDEYQLAATIDRNNFRVNKTEEKEYWKTLSQFISQLKENYTKHQHYFQMAAEEREKHFKTIKELISARDKLLLSVSALCKRNKIGITFLKTQLPEAYFQKLAFYFEKKSTLNKFTKN